MICLDRSSTEDSPTPTFPLAHTAAPKRPASYSLKRFGQWTPRWRGASVYISKVFKCFSLVQKRHALFLVFRGLCHDVGVVQLSFTECNDSSDTNELRLGEISAKTSSYLFLCKWITTVPETV